MPKKTYTIPHAALGLDKYNEPIYSRPTTPNIKNMVVTPTHVRKRSGYTKLGGNSLPLTGTGMEMIEYIDALGVYHLLALTTSNAYLFNKESKLWEIITPSVLLENCEDAWTDGGNSHTQATDATSGGYMRGSKSVKITLTSGASDGDKLAYENLASTVSLTDDAGGDYVDYDGTEIQLTEIGFWVKSSIALAANALEIVICEDADGAKTNTYVECLTTALVANTWTYVQLTKDLSACDSVDSVAIYANATIASGTSIWIDDVRAQKIFGGGVANRWSYGVVRDSNEFSNGGAALGITNGIGSNQVFFYEGAGGDTFKQHANNLASFASTRELIEFWNHFMFLDYTTSARDVRGIAWSDFNDCDSFAAGTYGATTITDSVGKILRAVKLKADMVIYSEESMTVCKYVGDPNIFVMPTLIYESGLYAPRAVHPFVDGHFILGTDKKVYKYEGRYYVDSIGELIEDALFGAINHANKEHIVAGIDPYDHKLHFCYPHEGDEDTVAYAKRSYAINYKQKPMTWEYHEFYDYIRGFSRYRQGYGWFADGPELEGTYADELMFYADESRTQEGGPVAVFLSDDGYVYRFDNTRGSDDGVAIDCIYDSGDIVADNDEYLRAYNFSFEAMSSLQDSTAMVWYSTDGGNSWRYIETVTISDGDINKWKWHRVPSSSKDLDVVSRRIRFRVRQVGTTQDLWVRRRCCVVDMKTSRD